jgi:hypothetical protein
MKSIRRSSRCLYATSAAVLLAATSLLPIHLGAQTRNSTQSRVPTVIDSREIDTLALRAHTRFLSDDLLRGRGTGTEGERLAASYIESQLIALNVTGLGSNGAYRIPVPLRTASILSTSSMTLRHGPDTIKAPYGTAFIANTGGAASFRDFTGDVVYAGAAATALPLLRSASDLRNKVVAFNGALGADATTIVPLLIERGAAGIIVLVADAAQYNLYVRSRGEARFFAAADVADPVWQPDIPVLIGGPVLIRSLFRFAGAAAATNTVTALVPLDIDAVVSLRTEMHDVPAANIAGVIRGTDARRRDQMIVFTAHYDHLGVSVPDEKGDSIYNGFSDNAAGCAMLLAIAEAFHRNPPPYSVAFLFFTGEERGLLGSSYMAAYPPFPLDRIKALINLDAGAPPVPPVSWRLAGGTEVPALGSLATGLARSAGWQTALSAASPNSDYWPFLHRGVPAVFIIPGNEWEKTTVAERDALRARWDHYHEAADEWHSDFPFAGLARYAAYALALGRAAAAR